MQSPIHFAALILQPIESWLIAAPSELAFSLTTGKLEERADPLYDPDWAATQYQPRYTVRKLLGTQLSRAADGKPSLVVEYAGRLEPVDHGGSNFHNHLIRLVVACPESELGGESECGNIRDYAAAVLLYGLQRDRFAFVRYRWGDRFAQLNPSRIQWVERDKIFLCSTTVQIGLTISQSCGV